MRIAAELSQDALSTVTQTKQAAMEIFSGASGAGCGYAKRHKPFSKASTAFNPEVEVVEVEGAMQRRGMKIW